jgi:SNF2 family DNA or RNA helicase
MIFYPHEYQKRAARHLAQNPHCALLADPGTGKTAIILALLRGLRRRNPNHRTLVIAPRRVIYDVWPLEVEKWDQFRELRVQILHGSKKDKAAELPADLYLLNPEGIQWAASRRVLDKFDTLIVDESTKLKNWTAKRTLILKRYLEQFRRRHILTGSPTPQNLADYFSQQFLVDMGQTLGHSIVQFRQDYFFDAAPMQNYCIWRPRRGAMEEILRKVSPYCLRLDGEELLDLPAIQVNDIRVPIPDPEDYRERVAEASHADGDTEADVEGRRGAGFTLSRQLSGGFYPDGRPYHAAKIEALGDLVEELGKPLLVFFVFRREGEAIRDRFKCPLIYGGTPDTEVREALTAWNKGELPVLACNPATTGHGLNLQGGGNHMAWYSLPSNHDDYFQAVRRLRRQGQTARTVFVHRLISPGTVDRRITRLLDEKAKTQKEFLEGVKHENTDQTG